MMLRRLLGSAGLALIPLILPAPQSAAAQGRTPYSLQPVFSHTWAEGVEPVIGDFDGDGFDEVASVHHDTGEIIFLRFVGDSVVTVGRLDADATGRVWSRWGAVGACDIDADGADELLVEYVRQDTLRLMGWNSRSGTVVNRPVAHGRDSYGEPYWDGKVHAVRVVNRGESEIGVVVCVAAQMDGAPRELVMFSEGLERVLWRYKGGAMMRCLSSLDFDGDGLDEVVFATSAPGNCRNAAKLPDSSSYLGVLDDDGTELWVESVGGEGTDAAAVIADLQNDGAPEVVCTVTPESDAVPQRSRLLVREPLTGASLGEAHIPERTRFPYLLHREGFGDRVAVVNTSGTLMLWGLSRAGPAMERSVETGTRVRIDCVAEVPGLPGPAIACQEYGGRAACYSPELELLARFEPAAPAKGWGGEVVGPYRRADGTVPLLAISGDALLLGAAPVALAPWTTAAAVAGALAALFAAVASLSAGFRRSVSSAFASMLSPFMPWVGVERARARFELVTELETGAHDRMVITRPLRRLARLLSMSVGDGATQERVAEVASRTLDAYRSTTAPSLARIADLALAWGGAARLSERLRGLASELEESLDGLCRVEGEAGVSAEAAARFGGEVDALESALQALLRHAGRAYVANVEAELERVLNGLEPTLLEAGVSVTVNVSGLRGVRAWVSPADLQFLLTNIVSNSLRAMAEADTRRLVVAAEPSGGFATLTFTDTGRGMSPEERENAFSLGGTSKPEGGGTGLYRSREALAPLGGTIEIAESGPGSGATIVVRLRLAPMFSEPQDPRPS